jgi:hypothetical protein
LKHVKGLKRWTGQIGLRPEQAVHLRRIAARNGLAGVVAYIEALDEWYYWPAQPTTQWALSMRTMALLCPHHRYPNTRDGLFEMVRDWRENRRVVVGEFTEPMPETLPSTDAPVPAAIRSTESSPSTA